MNIDTLYSVFLPVEQYRQFLLSTAASASSPFPLSAIDAYLMKQFADLYPQPPTVIDLAAAGSQGQTTALWAAHSNIDKLWVLCNPELSPLRMLWRSYCSRYGINCPTSPEFLSRSVAEERRTSHDTTLDKSCLLVNLLSLEDPNCDIFKQITDFTKEHLISNGNPTYLVLGLGKLGECPTINNLLRIDERLKGYRFQLVRELNPFLASSSLGIVYPEMDTFMGEIFSNISRRFTGNFDYSSVLRDLVTNTLAQNQERMETSAELSQLREENQRLRTLLAESERKESAEASNPVTLPIHSSPPPFFFARFLGQLFSRQSQ